MVSGALKIDFRTKMLMTIIIPCCLLLGNLPGKSLPVALAASVFPCFLLLLSGKAKGALQGAVMVVLAVLAQKYLLGASTGFFNSFLLLFIMMMLRMLPGLLMGTYAFATTDMSEVISSLKKLHLSDQIVIPVTVMARFFYTCSIDYRQIRNAMYLDGLTTGRLLLHPAKFLEYRIIPLLMVLTRTADEVSTSALTRGLEVDQKRSYTFDNHFKAVDLVCVLLMATLIFVTWGVDYA